MSSFNNTYTSADSNTTSNDPARDIFHDNNNSSSNSHTHSHTSHVSHNTTDSTLPTHSTHHTTHEPVSSRNFDSERGIDSGRSVEGQGVRPEGEAGGLTKSGHLGGDTFGEQPGSTHVSDHRRTVDPRNVDVTIGSKGDADYLPREETTASGGGPVSHSGGEGTGTNNTIPGGVKGTGGMGKRDGEDAMGGGGGMVGKIAEKLHMGHGNK
ncbi:hypothetical protein BDY24DRAFT_402042 [Mrakia frigida]|uniref:uncharacterized protein n=1 Tax=Mrakia frigida TaxID=29902 RepID=UPI003FCC024B